MILYLNKYNIHEEDLFTEYENETKEQIIIMIFWYSIRCQI